VRGTVKAPHSICSNAFVRDVEVNGMHMNLGSVLHGYGEAEESLTNQLRGEATRRILGAVKPIELPENAMIHAPTAEFQGFTKTGGLAVVPRELVANLGAVVNNKQKAELIVDTPLYIGQVENKAYLDIVKVGDNKYNYVKKVIEKENDPSKDTETVLASRKKIDEMNLEILTDKGMTTEKVGVFITDEMKQAVSFEETLAQFDEATARQIRQTLETGKDVETNLVKFTAPKNSTAKVTLTTKTKDNKPEVIEIDFEKALAQLNPEEANKIRSYHSIGKDYEISMDAFVSHEGNQLKIFDDVAAGKIGKDMDAARTAQEMANKEAAAAGKEPVKVKAPTIRFIAPQPAKAEVKFRTVFYDNKKFNMGGPKMAGLDKNIYNNHTTEAGETERFTYFCKYMYENLFESHRHADKPLKADWIIGNDWHTGQLSAMTRLLTPARKAHGEIYPRSAEKLYNTPITTLMHNFKLQGQANHSQEKLVNVMFGKHAAKIAENAWMPQKADMPGELMNGLFHGHDFNPQTMAMSYSDDIVFVSRGNFEEAAKVREKGGNNYMLASMRGRTWQFGHRERLEEIGKVYGINPEEIPSTATAKGITNGCDRVNNIITQAKARTLEEQLGMKVGSLVSDEVAIKDPFAAHQHNKREYLLQRVIPDVELARTTKGKENPMKLYDPETTDLTGVDENTMIYGMAGRIVDQKGIDIWVQGIKERMARGNYDKQNPPVYYIQGTGDESYMNMFLNVKRELRKTDPKAADRMVAAKLFSEKGRYDGCKMMSDFSVMPSWDEPCGLVHKEIGYTSGSISMVNKVCGLRDGLHEYTRGGGESNNGANSIFVNFVDKDTHSKEYALEQNGKAWADAMETAEEMFKDKKALANGINESYWARHDWLTGKVQEYVEIGKRHGVIPENVDSKYTL
jgi:glycogen synthase